jgi:hypothetical protein
LAGRTSQGASATAIGDFAGNFAQGAGSIAVGVASGSLSQQSTSIAVGYEAGKTSQGANSIAIGFQAGLTGQHARTTILNAQGSVLNSDRTDALFIAPIRNTGTAYNLFYNTTSKELTYQYPSSPLFLGEKSTYTSADNTFNTISFDTTNTTIVEDTLDWHSTTTNPSQVKPNIAGIYLATANGRLNNNNNTESLVQILLNGTTGIALSFGNGIAGLTASNYSCSAVVKLNGSTDYLEMRVEQDTANANETWVDIAFSVVLLRAT